MDPIKTAADAVSRLGCIHGQSKQADCLVCLVACVLLAEELTEAIDEYRIETAETLRFYARIAIEKRANDPLDADFHTDHYANLVRACAERMRQAPTEETENATAKGEQP